MRKTEYDFLTWTSFPSSIKMINDEPREWAWLGNVFQLSVKPGSKIRRVIKVKQQNVLYAGSHTPIDGWDGKTWRRLANLWLPMGSFGWVEDVKELTVPSDVTAIRGHLAGGGSGSPETPGITWFDDLKIYQDDVLIYENYFSATPRPLKIVPVFNFAETVVRVYQRVRPGIIKPK